MMETWIMVVWLLAADGNAAMVAKPTAITYPTQEACKKGHERAKSSLTTLVVGRSVCVRIVGAPDPK